MGCQNRNRDSDEPWNSKFDLVAHRNQDRLNTLKQLREAKKEVAVAAQFAVTHLLLFFFWMFYDVLLLLVSGNSSQEALRSRLRWSAFASKGAGEIDHLDSVVLASQVVCLVGFHTQADPLSLKRSEKVDIWHYFIHLLSFMIIYLPFTLISLLPFGFFTGRSCHFAALQTTWRKCWGLVASPSRLVGSLFDATPRPPHQPAVAALPNWAQASFGP